MTSSKSTPRGRLILVRHAESEGNRDRRFTATPEVPLTPAGHEQARRAGTLLGERFRPAALVVSPYRRARQTAEILAGALGLEATVEEAFREQHLGELAGEPYDLARGDPSFDPERRWEWRPRGGESLVDVQRRVAPAFDRLAAAHRDADVVLVSHGGVMLALWAHVAGTWESARPTGNAGIFVVEHDASGYGLPAFVEPGHWPARPALDASRANQ